MSLGDCDHCEEGTLVYQDNRIVCDSCETEALVYIKQLTASEVRYKLILIRSQFWFMFPDERTRIMLVTSQGEYSTNLEIPTDDYRRIRGAELNRWIRENSESFVVGVKVKLTRLKEGRYYFEIIRESVEDDETPPQTVPIGDHIELIAKLYQIGRCDDEKYVFIGRQERSRVEAVVGERSDDLPPYLIEQAERTGNDRISQIDCIFLIEEDDLVIPKTLFEVELSGNYDALIFRINSFLDCISNRWYNAILNTLRVIIIVPDEKVQRLEERISQEGQWQRIRTDILIEVWKVSETVQLFRSLVEEGRYSRYAILI